MKAGVAVLAVLGVLSSFHTASTPRFSITISATERTSWRIDDCQARLADGSCSSTYNASGTDDSTFASPRPVTVTLNQLRNAPHAHVFSLAAHTDRSVSGTWTTSSMARVTPARSISRQPSMVRR